MYWKANSNLQVDGRASHLGAHGYAYLPVGLAQPRRGGPRPAAAPAIIEKFISTDFQRRKPPGVIISNEDNSFQSEGA